MKSDAWMLFNILWRLFCDKIFLKNHKFFVKFDLKQKTGKKHVTSIDFDTESILKRFLEHFSIE